MRCLRICVALSCLLITIPALAQPPQTKAVSFDNPGTIILVSDPPSADAPTVQARFAVLMKNEGSEIARVCFSLTMQDAKGRFVSPFIGEEGSTPKDKVICAAQTITARGIQFYALQAELENPAPPFSGILIAETQTVSKPKAPKARISVPVRLGALPSDLPKPDIAFTDPAVSTLVATTGDGLNTTKISFVTTLTNKGAAGATLYFLMQLQDDQGRISNPPITLTSTTHKDSTKETERNSKGQAIDPAETASYSLQVSLDNFTRPLSGFLVVQVAQRADPKISLSKPLRIVRNMQPHAAHRIFWIPFGAALLSVSIVFIIIISGKHSLTSRM